MQNEVKKENLNLVQKREDLSIELEKFTEEFYERFDKNIKVTEELSQSLKIIANFLQESTKNDNLNKIAELLLKSMEQNK